MVEFALVLILSLGMVMAIFEGARLVAAYFIVANAAADGARTGAFVSTSQRPLSVLDADIRAAVRETTSMLGALPDEAIAICRRTSRTAPCGTTVQSGSVVDVTVSYRFDFLPFAGGWLGRTSIELTGQSRAQVD
jgi:hypothetical protein